MVTLDDNNRLIPWKVSSSSIFLDVLGLFIACIYIDFTIIIGKISSKKHPVVLNGQSDVITDSSASVDEIQLVKQTLANASASSDQSSSEDSDKANSSMYHHSQKRKDSKPSLSNFVANLSKPPNQDLDFADYFISMFGTKSIELSTEKSNLYPAQANPTKPLDILIMISVYVFPPQSFFCRNDTHVDSIAAVMSRDRFLSIKKNLHLVDNSQ